MATMRWLVMLGVFMGAVHGCKLIKRADTGKSRPLIDIGKDRSLELGALPGCGDLFSLVDTGKSPDAHSYRVLKSYEFRRNQCIRLYVGYYSEAQRAFSLGLEHDLYDFNGTVALMQRYGIRCVDRGESLALEFPQHKDDTTSQYRELVVHCSPSSRLVWVLIGAMDKNSDRLAISVYDEEEKEEVSIEVNYFETNTQGEIIGHSKNMVDHEGNLEAHMIMHRTVGRPE